MTMFDPEKVPAYLRTIVPSLWGSLIAWLVLQVPQIPDNVHVWLVTPLVVSAVVSAVIVAWYAFWRWLEPRMAPWLTRIVLGSNLTPSYTYDESESTDDDDYVDYADVPDGDGNFVTDSAGKWNADDIGNPTPSGE